MNRLVIYIFAFLLLTVDSEAQVRFGPTSGQGPFTVNDYGIANQYPGNVNTAGKTLVSSALVGGQKTLIFLVVGQSLVANDNGTSLYTPVSSLAHMFNIYSGLTYQCLDPVLGASDAPAWTWLCRFADNVISTSLQGAQRVIIIPVGINGSSSDEWGTGVLYSRLQVAANYARKLGWPITAVLWQQGQADVTLGTSSAQYQLNVRTAQSILIGQGFDVPWVIAISTMLANVTDATIQSAQAALVDNSAKRYAGPNTDLLTGAGNLLDGTHFTNAGLATVASTGSSGFLTAVSNMCTAIGGC